MALAPALSQVLFAPFSPLKIAGCVLWLDASRLPGFADGDPVGTWPDLSGQSNNATQATASKKPTYKVNVVNGRPVVRFDGVDDFLQASFGLAQPHTRLAVVLNRSVANGTKVMMDGISDPRGYFYYPAASTFGIYSGAQLLCAASVNTLAWQILRGTFAGASSVVSVNGGATTLGNAGALAANGITIGVNGGGASYTDFDIPEVMEYSRALTDGEVSKLFRYLGQKYGIAVS